MKSLAHKLLAFSFVIALTTGCASVTSSNLSDQPQKQDIKKVKKDNDHVQAGDGEDMQLIYDKPE